MNTQAPTNLQHLQSIKEKTIALRNLLLMTHDAFSVDVSTNIATAVDSVIDDLVSGLNYALDDIYTLMHLSEYPANQTLISNEELDGTMILLGTTLRMAMHQITSYYAYDQLNNNATYAELVKLEAHVSVMTRALQKEVADEQVNNQQTRWDAGVPHPEATCVSDRLKAFEHHATTHSRGGDDGSLVPVYWLPDSKYGISMRPSLKYGGLITEITTCLYSDEYFLMLKDPYSSEFKRHRIDRATYELANGYLARLQFAPYWAIYDITNEVTIESEIYFNAYYRFTHLLQK